MSILHSEWDPSTVCRENTIALEQLKDQNFIKLKKQVVEATKDSWCSSEKSELLMDLVFLTRPKVCVEIGVLKGSSILPVATVLKFLKKGRIFAIDAWSNGEASKYLADDDPNKLWWSRIDMNAIYKSFTKMIKKWSLENICLPIPKSSEKAVEVIPNDIDFLHLDGDYSEMGALKDVTL